MTAQAYPLTWPDAGGSQEAMAELNRAREKAMK